MATTKVPQHLTEGLAKDDLSNVNAAAALTALGAAKAALSNVDPVTGRVALGAVSVDCGDSLGRFCVGSSSQSRCGGGYIQELRGDRGRQPAGPCGPDRQHAAEKLDNADRNLPLPELCP